MENKKRAKPVFKQYSQGQTMLLPPSLDELIPVNHLVRTVNSTVDSLDIAPLIDTYIGGGTSSYHPRMLVKVIVYAYLQKIYSSRKIAKALREDINFMWLSAMNQPDFRTINGFRSERLKDVIDKVFGSMLTFLVDNKYVKMEDYFVDGTKMQADSNKHKITWRKNVERYKAQTREKIKELLKHIDEVNEEENKRYGDKDLEELGEEATIDSESLKQEVERLNEILKESKPDKADKEGMLKHKEVEKAVKQIQKKELPKLEKYEKQEEILAGRNSYSKTDTDATAHRMKDGSLLPSYNILAGSENQFILNYSIHQNPGETGLFIEHLKKLIKTGLVPNNAIGDSAFGSEENYDFLQDNEIENYLKYNTFHQEMTKAYHDNPFNKDNFTYDKETNTYECPQKKKLIFKEDKEVKTSNGYLTKTKIYECEDCSECPFSEKCKKGKGNRTVQRNEKLENYRKQARENLNSKMGLKLRKRRGVDIEPVWADIKWNQGYRRFRLRGLKKVNIEFGLLAMVHNIKRIQEINRERKESYAESLVKSVANNDILNCFYFCWIKAA
jgi:transposase